MRRGCRSPRARGCRSWLQDARIVAFRSSPNDTREHVALVIGEQRAERTPLVRLHSECLTGDVLGSLKCDCGPQLDAALHAMADEAAKGGWGVLLYMRQEGRGIGIINKLRAYRLQDQGFDTVDANTRLGLPDEARDFPTAARMLELLKIEKIRLMTNNPAKVEALAAQGHAVTERVSALRCPTIRTMPITSRPSAIGRAISCDRAIAIRPESPDDAAAIHAVIKAAFLGMPFADGDEQHLPAQLARGWRPGAVIGGGGCRGS